MLNALKQKQELTLAIQFNILSSYIIKCIKLVDEAKFYYDETGKPS